MRVSVCFLLLFGCVGSLATLLLPSQLLSDSESLATSGCSVVDEEEELDEEEEEDDFPGFPGTACSSCSGCAVSLFGSWLADLVLPAILQRFKGTGLSGLFLLLAMSART